MGRTVYKACRVSRDGSLRSVFPCGAMTRTYRDADGNCPVVPECLVFETKRDAQYWRCAWHSFDPTWVVVWGTAERTEPVDVLCDVSDHAVGVIRERTYRWFRRVVRAGAIPDGIVPPVGTVRAYGFQMKSEV